jgi:tetratricopeptide (TPR) repeat protein
MDGAIKWYKKALDVNPRNSDAYHNMGTIYKNRQEYSKAVECFRNAVENHSTFTLGYANLAICLLQLEKYQDAFAAFKRAKELLPTDNNNLSEDNKGFLKENLEKFDKEGEKWRKTGSIDAKQKEDLKYLIKSFESNFNKLYSGEASLSISDARALKSEVLQIVNIVY